MQLARASFLSKCQCNWYYLLKLSEKSRKAEASMMHSGNNGEKWLICVFCPSQTNQAEGFFPNI